MKKLLLSLILAVICFFGSTMLTCAQTALTFPNAASAYATATDNTALNVPAGGSVTITTWAKTTGTGYQMFLTKRAGGAGAGAGFDLFFYQGKFVVNCVHTGGTTGTADFTAPKLVNDGKWHHLAFVMDNTSGYKLYVDGLVQATKAIVSTTGVTIAAPLLFGKRDVSASPLPLIGSLDEVRIYDKALSADELVTDMSTNVTSATANLKAAWNFNEGTGTTAADIKTTNPATITGAVTWTSTTPLTASTLTFAAPITKALTDADFSPATNVSAIQYTSSNTAVATVLNSQIHIVGVGTSIITASQAANLFYSAATPVTQTLTVGTIALTTLNNDITAATALQTAAITGTNPGQYSASAISTFNAAIVAASSVRDNVASTDLQRTNASAALATATSTFTAAVNPIKLSTVSATVWYAIKNGNSASSIKYIKDNGIAVAAVAANFAYGDDAVLWKVVDVGSGNVNIISKNNGQQLTNQGVASALILLTTTPQTRTIAPLGQAQFNINGGGNSVHLNGTIMGWNAGLNSGSAWFFEEVGLTQLIADAETTYTAGIVGINPGQVTTANKATFRTAIDAAIALKANGSATPAQVDAGMLALTTAKAAFLASRNAITLSTAGNDTWYYIKGTRGSTATAVFAQDMGGALQTLDKEQSAINAQYWKVVANGAGKALVNRLSGAYMNADLGTGSNLGTKAAMPTKPLVVTLISQDATSGNGNFMIEDIYNGATAFRVHAGGSGNNWGLMNYTGGTQNYTTGIDPTYLFQFITVTNAANVITFGAIAAKTYGAADFTVSATASSTLAVSYVSSDPTVATVDASTGLVHILKTGTTTITASQAGNINFASATPVTQLLIVNTKPLIAITNAVAANKVYDGTTSATITGTFEGIVGSDVVTLNGNFENAAVCDGKAVTSSTTLSGAQAGNYTFTGAVPAGLTANITPATTTISANTNLSTSGLTVDQLANSDLVVSSGELVIDQNPTVRSITVNPGAKLTLADGKTLAAGVLTLQSNATSTATFVDQNSGINPPEVSATVQQYLTSGRNWYVSSPVASTTTAALSTAGSVQYWDEPNGVWETAASGSVLNPLQGYVSVGTTGNGAVTFNGTLNNGAKLIALTRTPGATKEGFNLIGNPYPSYLNVMTAINADAKMEKSIWYRTRNLSNTYVFDAVNTTTGIGTNNNQSGEVKGYVPPMQAFWVRVADGNASTTLTFDNSMRSHKSDGNTAMKAPSKAKASASPFILRLQVSNGINSDETVLYGNDAASNEFDVYDSQKMSNNNNAIAEIYTTVGTEQLAINGLNALPLDTEIPLGVKTGSCNSLSLQATEITNLPSDVKVVIKDNFYQTENELAVGSAYNFTPEAASSASRFSLIFKSAGAVTEVQSAAGGLNALVYGNGNKQIAVQFNAQAMNTCSVAVYNSVGQKLVDKMMAASTGTITGSLKPGVYVVTLTVNGNKITRKVVIN